MVSLLARKTNQCAIVARYCTSKITKSPQAPARFEPVFSFPIIKYLALFNRLKAYHITGSAVVIPSSGLLEMLNILPHQSFLTATYIGVTGAAVLTLASFPFNNTIGFLYISEDNKQIKISSLNFWGKRVDKIIPTEDWVPLLDMAPKKMDAVYLTPQVADKTKYKWFVKFGNVLNSRKIGQVLD